MKKRVKYALCALALVLAMGSTLTSCAFRNNMDSVIASPGLRLMPSESLSFNLESDGAVAVPNEYWMYEDLDSLVRGSDLIALGRINGSEEKVVRMRTDSESFHELFTESATMIDIEPIVLVKGGSVDSIRVASYEGIAKNTLAQSTLDLYEGESAGLPVSHGCVALFFLKNAGGDMYFPVNLSQGLIPVLDGKLLSSGDNSAIPTDTELPDAVDSIRYLMNFLDEPTAANYRPFILEED